jgi:hypothetical protein
MADTGAISVEEDLVAPGVWQSAVADSLSEHRHFLIFCAYYLTTVLILLARLAPDTAAVMFGNALATIVGHSLFVLLAALIWAALFLMRSQPNRPLPALAAEFRSLYLSPAYLGRVAPVLFCIPLVFGAFFTLKVHIADLSPYRFDKTVASVGSWLNGGVPTWRLLQTWFGRPWITALLNAVYYAWFPVVHATFYWQVFSFRRPALRLQFITAFVACWGLLGSFAALAFSSAGPAFLHALSGKPTPYDGLIAYLNHVQQSGYTLTSLQVQDVLWRSYETHTVLPFAGISAMPSMHVSMAVLAALFGWRIGKLTGLAYTLFAILIFLGSVLLAFHYALDGYVGGLLTLIIWIACGRLARHVHSDADDGRAA